MANWISSKLKVAETFLEQIDQQAAELKKNERPLGSDDKEFQVPTKSGTETVSLKDQLKKKKKTSNETDNDNNINGYFGKLKTDSNINNVIHYSNISNSNSIGGDKEIGNVSKISPKPKPTLTDSDWTELLSTPPTQAASSSSSMNRSYMASAIRGLRKDGKMQGTSGFNLSVLEGKVNVKSSGGVKSKRRLDIALGNKSNGKQSDDEESNSSARSSSVELRSNGKTLDREEMDRKDIGITLMDRQSNQETEKDGVLSELKDMSEKDVLQMENKGRPLEMSSVSDKVGGTTNVKKGVGNVYDRLRSTVKGKHQSDAASRSSVSDDFKKGSSTSDGGSDSDSDSVSISDSESEREREMREKILAEKAAAKAVEIIKEQENMVARLEGEKQSLEKILEERAKQQAQEASELQTTMMEMMEAVELEKRKHNNTRMEALGRLAKLETANADLSKSLAISQKNLELEINRVVELRQQFELKETSYEELRRKIFKTHQTETFLSHAAASRGVEFEREILEAEYSILTDKIGRLEDKAKKLEANIEMTRKDIEDPTEVEIELKRRLGQLTDHLIQKQSQVEALSSEKSTLLFRIEAVSSLLEENRSTSRDPESGTWEIPDSKLRPLFEDKIRSGRKHLGSLLRQLDAIFVAGALFVTRNPAAKLWSLAYLVCLHFWVIYILLSHSQASVAGGSGAVISLENINQTTGV